jgi:CBS domain-containing protein
MPHAASLLIREVVVATQTDSVLEAARLMRQAKTGCVVVIEGGRAKGILSERDVLNRVVAEGKDPARTKVVEVMTPDPVTVDAAQPLDKVFAVLAEGRFRHLPVTENGRLVGIVSLTDLAKVLREVYKEERYIQYFADYMESRRKSPPASAG